MLERRAKCGEQSADWEGSSLEFASRLRCEIITCERRCDRTVVPPLSTGTPPFDQLIRWARAV